MPDLKQWNNCASSHYLNLPQDLKTLQMFWMASATRLQLLHSWIPQADSTWRVRRRNESGQPVP